MVVACLPWIALPVWAGELSQEEKSAGFVSMFNGREFTGWRFTGDTPPEEVTNWKVVDGVIQLSGGGSPHLARAGRACAGMLGGGFDLGEGVRTETTHRKSSMSPPKQ
jgi:hypothetical protein